MRSSLSQTSPDWSMPAHVAHVQGASWMGMPSLPQNTGSKAASRTRRPCAWRIEVESALDLAG